MKLILDPAFDYPSSLRTDVPKTFDRRSRDTAARHDEEEKRSDHRSCE